MKQFGFYLLSDDDQLLILKYMPIKERVRFERVNSNWASLLEGLWKSQKQLQFGLDEPPKLANCHQIDLNDKCEVKYIPPKEMLKIISKCKTLKTLGLDTSSRLFEHWSLATKLANILNENCKEIEHLNLQYVHVSFFELFGPCEKFTCLVYLTYERLELLHRRMSIPVGRLPMKLVYPFGRGGCPLSWDLINKATVEHLKAKYWEDKYNELINLKSFHVDFNMSGEVGTFRQLEQIRLRLTSNTDLRRIFKESLKLVSLKLSFPDDASKSGELMSTIFEFGSNLKVLEIDHPKGNAMGDYVFWQNLAKLTKLRTLDIQAHWYGRPKFNLNVNGLILLFETCTKLKCLHIKYRPKDEGTTTEAEKEQIRTAVANKSFKQPFVVRFDYSNGCHTITVGVGQQSVSV